MHDRTWTESSVRDLVDGGHWRTIPGTDKVAYVDSGRPTYMEQRMASIDRGNALGALDCVQFDMALHAMTDLPAKLAMLAHLYGFDYADIGALVRDRRRRTGAMLVESAVRAIVRHERRRAGR